MEIESLFIVNQVMNIELVMVAKGHCIARTYIELLSYIGR